MESDSWALASLDSSPGSGPSWPRRGGISTGNPSSSSSTWLTGGAGAPGAGDGGGAYAKATCAGCGKRSGRGGTDAAGETATCVQCTGPAACSVTGAAMIMAPPVDAAARGASPPTLTSTGARALAGRSDAASPAAPSPGLAAAVHCAGRRGRLATWTPPSSAPSPSSTTPTAVATAVGAAALACVGMVEGADTGERSLSVE
jgi:hypothetical protein